MQRSQSGNALIYILIAIILLGALSYAVTQTTGGGSTKDISDNRARTFATEIIETANSYAAAVAQLRLRGTEPTEICFDHTSWGASNYNHAGCTDAQNKIFDPQGGGINWSNAPAEAMDSAVSPDNLWHFYGNNEIKNVGTTSGTAAGADLIILVDELSLKVCQHLNDLLGIAESNATPPTDTTYGTTRFVGAFSYTATIGDESSTLAGKTAACFKNTTTGKYAFYKVLLAR